MPRRSHSRRAGRAVKKGETFWYRPPSFSLTERNAGSGVFSSLLLVEADFQDPSDELNNTVQGSPVLERIIADISFAQVYNDNYFAPAGFNQVTCHVEALIHTQSNPNTPDITNSTTFNNALKRDRILGYGIMKFDANEAIVADQNMMDLSITFSPKTKFRLREKAVAVAIRTNFDLGNAASLANFNSCQATMLISQP